VSPTEMSERFRSEVEAWAARLGITKKQLYQVIESSYGRTVGWTEARQRGMTPVRHADLEWLLEVSIKEATEMKIIDVDQYVCYDCEESNYGKPFYTMIPKVSEDPGAFLCPNCFKGLEVDGYEPDDPNDPRWKIE